MKNLLKATLILLATLSITHLAQADENLDLINENQENKILASMEWAKTDAIQEMQKIVNEMYKIQDQIDESSRGDSHGRLTAVGQMIDIVSNTIKDAEKLNSDTDYGRIQDALAGVKKLRDEAKALNH